MTSDMQDEIRRAQEKINEKFKIIEKNLDDINSKFEELDYQEFPLQQFKDLIIAAEEDQRTIVEWAENL